MTLIWQAHRMSEQPEPISDEQIRLLLPQLQKADGQACEFAFAHVMAFEYACHTILQWQRKEGRRRVIAGEEPQAIENETIRGYSRRGTRCTAN